MNKTKIVDIEVKENEDIVYPFLWLNGENTDVTLRVKMVGDNSTLLLCGIFVGNDHNSIVFNTDVAHIGRNTKSLTTIRAVLFDNASISNDGMIRIMKGAKNTDGYFQSKILLFDDAKGRSVPSLEIDENEVKAGHGSTIGRPEPNQLFYLRSRGLTEREAEALIVSGFFDPTLQLLPNKLKNEIKAKINKVFDC